MPPPHLFAITSILSGVAVRAVVAPDDSGYGLFLTRNLAPVGCAVRCPGGLWRIVLSGDDAFPQRFSTLRAAAVAALGERINEHAARWEREQHEHHSRDPEP